MVTGKKELDLEERNLVPASTGQKSTIHGVLANALPFYVVDKVTIDAALDGDLAGLVVTQPGEDYTDEELRRIDDFVMSGRALVVVASAANVAPYQANMNATLGTHRLERLLGAYGVQMANEVILDPASAATVPVVGPGGTKHTPLPSIPVLGPPNLDASFSGFYRLKEVAFPFASPLVVHADKQAGATFRVVASSSKSAVTVSTSPVDLGYTNPSPVRGEHARRAIAVAIEGRLESAFGSTSTENGRVLVVSSSQFLANPFARAGNPPPLPPQMEIMGSIGGDEDLQRIATPYAERYLTSTILALKNIFDWMGANDDLVACSALLATVADEKEGGVTSEKGATGCTKEQMLKLLDAGHDIDAALEICGAQKRD